MQDAKDNEECLSDSKNEEIIYFHCKSSVSDGEEFLCGSSKESKLKTEIFDQKKSFESDMNSKRIENEGTKYVEHSQNCHSENSSEVIDASSPVVKQVRFENYQLC